MTVTQFQLCSKLGRLYMVQLKGNLIPARMLQVDNSQVKITSCIQYMNRHLSRLYLHQANCRACAPANVVHSFEQTFNKD